MQLRYRLFIPQNKSCSTRSAFHITNSLEPVYEDTISKPTLPGPTPLAENPRKQPTTALPSQKHSITNLVPKQKGPTPLFAPQIRNLLFKIPFLGYFLPRKAYLELPPAHYDRTSGGHRTEKIDERRGWKLESGGWVDYIWASPEGFQGWGGWCHERKTLHPSPTTGYTFRVLPNRRIPDRPIFSTRKPHDVSLACFKLINTDMDDPNRSRFIISRFFLPEGYDRLCTRSLSITWYS